VRVHSLTLSCTPGSIRFSSWASLLSRTLASPCLGHEPKARVTRRELSSTHVHPKGTLEESIVVVDLDVHNNGIRHCETTKQMFTPQHEVARVEGDEAQLVHVTMQNKLLPLQEVN